MEEGQFDAIYKVREVHRFVLLYSLAFSQPLEPMLATNDRAASGLEDGLIGITLWPDLDTSSGAGQCCTLLQLTIVASIAFLDRPDHNGPLQSYQRCPGCGAG